MRHLDESDKKYFISITTKEEQATVEAIMGLLNGYPFNKAEMILKFSETLLSTALVDSTKCAQFFEE